LETSGSKALLTVKYQEGGNITHPLKSILSKLEALPCQWCP